MDIKSTLIYFLQHLWRRCSSYEMPVAVGGATAYFYHTLDVTFLATLLIAVGAWIAAEGIMLAFEKLNISQLPRRQQITFFATILGLVILTAAFWYHYY